MRWSKLFPSVFLVGLTGVVTSGSPALNFRSDYEETPGEPRLLASLVFPFFPQFYGVNYGETMESLTKSDTIGYFVLRDIYTVSKHLLSNSC